MLGWQEEEQEEASPAGPTLSCPALPPTTPPHLNNTTLQRATCTTYAGGRSHTPSQHTSCSSTTERPGLAPTSLISAAGALYHIRWGQDPDTGELRLRSYWQDPASASALELPAGQADGDGEGDDDASVCDGEEAEGEEEEGEQASLP